MRWTRERCARRGSQGGATRERSNGAQDERRCCGRRSRVVLAPVAGVKFAEAHPARPGLDEPSIRGRRWQKEFVTGESTKETVKTIAQGRPDDSAYTCGLYPCAFYCTGGRGCGGHPAFPAPSVFRRDKFDANLGRIAPRDGARVCLSSSLRAKRSNPESSAWPLDCFASLAMTGRLF